jgi:hypothetical protein
MLKYANVLKPPIRNNLQATHCPDVHMTKCVSYRRCFGDDLQSIMNLNNQNANHGHRDWWTLCTS